MNAPRFVPYLLGVNTGALFAFLLSVVFGVSPSDAAGPALLGLTVGAVAGFVWCRS